MTSEMDETTSPGALRQRAAVAVKVQKRYSLVADSICYHIANIADVVNMVTSGKKRQAIQ